jgi:hypothetical protein
MKKILFCLILFFFFIKVEAQTDYSGNFGFQHKIFNQADVKVKRNKDDVGRMGNLTLFKIDNNKYKFWLSANRGWPSYNQGDIDGIINIISDTAVFKITQEDSQLPCVIAFKFSTNYIELEQRSTDADCSFGWNVYADGKYRKRKLED